MISKNALRMRRLVFAFLALCFFAAPFINWHTPPGHAAKQVTDVIYDDTLTPTPREIVVRDQVLGHEIRVPAIGSPGWETVSSAIAWFMLVGFCGVSIVLFASRAASAYRE